MSKFSQAYKCPLRIKVATGAPLCTNKMYIFKVVKSSQIIFVENCEHHFKWPFAFCILLIVATTPSEL